MTPDDLRKKGYEYRNGQWSKVGSAARVEGVCHPVAERAARQKPLAAGPDQAGGARRRVVRIIRFGARLLDADNFAGGTKFLTDAIRRAGLIPNDDPGSVTLEFEQVRVKTRKEQKTVVEIWE